MKYIRIALYAIAFLLLILGLTNYINYNIMILLVLVLLALANFINAYDSFKNNNKKVAYFLIATSMIVFSFLIIITIFYI